MTSGHLFIWTLDSADRLVSWNDAFTEFARANGAPDLPTQLAGTAIYDHIVGLEMRELHRLLLRAARAGARISIPFSCDAPHERRYFNMKLKAATNGSVTYQSRVLSVIPKSPGLPRLELIKICSWCGKIEDDGWHPPETVVERRGLLIEPVAPHCTHGICPDCYERVAGEFAAPFT